MNPLLQNVVPPDGLTGTLINTITELQREKQTLSEENDNLKTMNQLLLMAYQTLMEKLGMTDAESNGQVVFPLTATHPSQLPPAMLPLLSQVLPPIGPPVSKEEIEEVSNKIEGMEKKCQMIFSLLTTHFGITHPTSNQEETAAFFKVPTVNKTRIPKVSSQRNSRKKKFDIGKLIDNVFSGKTETQNEPSTSIASAHAVIDTSVSVPISFDQRYPKLNQREESQSFNLQDMLFDKKTENIGMWSLPGSKIPRSSSMNVSEQPNPAYPVNSFNYLSGDTVEDSIQTNQAGNCESPGLRELLEFLNTPQPCRSIPSASSQPPIDVPAHFDFSPDRAELPGASTPSSDVLSSSPVTEISKESDPVLSAQMSMLQAMLRSPQNNSPSIPSPTAIIPTLDNFPFDRRLPNATQNPICVIQKHSFGEALYKWSLWPHKNEKLPPIDLESFLFNPFGIQAVPQAKLSAHDGSYLYKYCLKKGLVVNQKFKYWGKLSLKVQSQWLDLAETLTKWQSEQIEMGLICTMDQPKQRRMDVDIRGISMS